MLSPSFNTETKKRASQHKEETKKYKREVRNLVSVSNKRSRTTKITEIVVARNVENKDPNAPTDATRNLQ